MPKKVFEPTDWVADASYDEPDMPEDGSKRQIGIRILAVWICLVLLTAALYFANLRGPWLQG